METGTAGIGTEWGKRAPVLVQVPSAILVLPARVREAAAAPDAATNAAAALAAAAFDEPPPRCAAAADDVHADLAAEETQLVSVTDEVRTSRCRGVQRDPTSRVLSESGAQ